ncbi:MAG: sulfate reduction electron transfer complex DsrMKJOP subunit DsrJ [Desulforegulaceae bacterium]|nr:sulfate reduction electron transfer complex DsrMKJOP subunit DsrJ [Desulforegulaceae bacterium]
MSDKIKVLAGFIIFAGIISIPFWISAGKMKPAPDPVLSEAAQKAGSCIEENMAANHMQILDIFRDTVVRNGERIYTNKKGEKFKMSLSTGSDSCLGCHESKADFCDKCHDYAGVKDPFCWECHIDPKENK